MTFSVTQVTRKKDPQQQVRFKMTNDKKTLKNRIQCMKTFNFEINRQINKNKSQALFASYVPDSHIHYILKTFLPPAPDYRVCFLCSQ